MSRSDYNRPWVVEKASELALRTPDFRWQVVESVESAESAESEEWGDSIIATFLYPQDAVAFVMLPKLYAYALKHPDDPELRAILDEVNTADGIREEEERRARQDNGQFGLGA